MTPQELIEHERDNNPNWKKDEKSEVLGGCLVIILTIIITIIFI